MGMRILVVDDTPEPREALAAMLRAKGFETLCAADGEAALEMIRQRRPDLILLDLVMDQMHGLTLIDILRHDAEQARIPVIVFSEEKDALGEGPVELGPCQVMEKAQFSLGELLRCIGRMLGIGEQAAA